MTTNGSVAIVNRAGAGQSRSLAARVAKPCAASNFRNDRATDDDPTSGFCAQSQNRGLSRSETTEHTPLWYGPRLRPAFVAQLLAQVFYPVPPDAPSATAAYEQGLARGDYRTGLGRRL